MKYLCPICGYKGLNEDPAPYFGSFEICPCCGVEFGYQIVRSPQGGIANRVKELRGQWIDAGAPFVFENEKPNDWDLEKQLKTIGITLNKELIKKIKFGKKIKPCYMP